MSKNDKCHVCNRSPGVPVREVLSYLSIRTSKEWMQENKKIELKINVLLICVSLYMYIRGRDSRKQKIISQKVTKQFCYVFNL